jgi:hypothetical protein
VLRLSVARHAGRVAADVVVVLFLFVVVVVIDRRAEARRGRISPIEWMVPQFLSCTKQQARGETDGGLQVRLCAGPWGYAALGREERKRGERQPGIWSLRHQMLMPGLIWPCSMTPPTSCFHGAWRPEVVDDGRFPRKPPSRWFRRFFSKGKVMDMGLERPRSLGVLLSTEYSSYFRNPRAQDGH